LNRINLLLLLILTVCFMWAMSNLRLSSSNMSGREGFAKENNYDINTQGIEITVIYDNYLFKSGLKTSWGFSCIVKGTEKTILFDTGGDGDTLLNNMTALAIVPEEVDVVVLSHIHGDHVGGLDDFLEQNPKVTVYIPQSFPLRFKENIRECGTEFLEIKDGRQICQDVYTTGEMGLGIKEQSLVIRTEKGIIVITGCAHPGIVDIVKKAKDLLKEDVLLVMGGFHLMGHSPENIESIISQFRALDVHFVGPCHCSGDTTRQLFEKEYGKNYINIGVGKMIHYNDLLE
jgi:7,8-dihydropterin-6-yl-methyl-4-(beta-D-ribofuranosyl)aminobenzene 5'-phosphate synthase